MKLRIGGLQQLIDKARLQATRTVLHVLSLSSKHVPKNIVIGNGSYSFTSQPVIMEMNATIEYHPHIYNQISDLTWSGVRHDLTIINDWTGSEWSFTGVFITQLNVEHNSQSIINIEFMYDTACMKPKQ